MLILDFTQMMFIKEILILYIFIENKHWDKLDKAGLHGKKLLQGINDHKGGGIWFGSFLAPKKVLFN